MIQVFPNSVQKLVSCIHLKKYEISHEIQLMSTVGDYGSSLCISNQTFLLTLSVA